MFFEAAQQQGPEFGGQAAAGDALGDGGLLGGAGDFIGLEEILLGTEVARLDEVDDAPEVEQAVFEGRAGEGQAVFGLELFDRLGDLGAGVFDELCLVEDEGTEAEFAQGFQVAAQEGVIGDDEVVLGDLTAQVVAFGAAFEHEHGEVGCEPLGFPAPVVEDGGRADDQ